MRPNWRAASKGWLERPGPGRGVVLMLFSTLGGSVMIAVVKALAFQIHPLEIGFFRNLLGLVFLAPFLFAESGTPLRTGRLGLHACRGLVTTGAILLSFVAISLNPLATVASLNFTSPLFAVALAVAVLGERWGWGRVFGLGLGLAGTAAILRPGFVAFDFGPLVALAAALGFAVAMVLIKVLGRTESSLVVTFYTLLFGLPLAGLAAIPVWIFPTAGEMAGLVAMALIGAFHQWSFVQAFKDADVSLVAPLTFTNLIWAALIGHALFGESPDSWTWVGGSLIFAGATVVILREGGESKAGRSAG